MEQSYSGRERDSIPRTSKTVQGLKLRTSANITLKECSSSVKVFIIVCRHHVATPSGRLYHPSANLWSELSAMKLLRLVVVVGHVS